jgi:hypothetical protein
MSTVELDRATELISDRTLWIALLLPIIDARPFNLAFRPEHLDDAENGRRIAGAKYIPRGLETLMNCETWVSPSQGPQDTSPDADTPTRA